MQAFCPLHRRSGLQNYLQQRGPPFSLKTTELGGWTTPLTRKRRMPVEAFRSFRGCIAFQLAKANVRRDVACFQALTVTRSY
jgi:hypothetical protein